MEFQTWSRKGSECTLVGMWNPRRVSLPRHRPLSSTPQHSFLGALHIPGKMKDEHTDGRPGGSLSRRIQGPVVGCPLQRESEISALRVTLLSETPTQLPGAQGRTSSCAGPVHSGNQGPLLKNDHECSHVGGRGLNQEEGPSECTTQWCTGYMSKAAPTRGTFRKTPWYYLQRKCMQVGGS